MTRNQLKVVVTRRLPEPVQARLRELFDVTLSVDDAKPDRAGLLEAMKNTDVLVPCVTDHIDAAMLEEAGDRLQLIANFGAGVDHIDVLAAHRHGVRVTNTPGVVTEDTADMTMALILAVSRRLPEGMGVAQEGAWGGWAPTAFMGQSLTGKVLGILGMGRIGQAVARRAKAFGMDVMYHNRHQLHSRIEEDLEAAYRPSLDQMLARVDFLSINCPHTPSTFHQINARRLKLMKPSAIIVNTSRGEVIDENALTRALRAGELAGAGLDVFERGHVINPRLRALPNVVLLPHMGSATVEGRTQMGEAVLVNIHTFCDGHRPPDLVVPEMV